MMEKLLVMEKLVAQVSPSLVIIIKCERVKETNVYKYIANMASSL